MNTFRSGVADRGASIRIPLPVQLKGYGYLEDRRPAANVVRPKKPPCAMLGMRAKRVGWVCKLSDVAPCTVTATWACKGLHGPSSSAPIIFQQNIMAMLILRLVLWVCRRTPIP